MRKYQHIWERLKGEQYLQITAPRKSHSTIMQGIRKESLADAGYRFKCVERGEAYKIGYNSVGDLLYIRLEWSSTIPVNFTYRPRKGDRNE